MLIHSNQSLQFAVIAICGLQFFWTALATPAQQPKAESKSASDQSDANKPATEKPAVEKIDPVGRPEGAIYDQSARVYVFYEDGAWHLHTTAKNPRTFTGVIRTTDAKIMTCVSVGLKNDKKQKTPDAWQVNAERNELQFRFVTAKASDGFAMTVKGDEGQLEFDLAVDGQKNPKEIFIGPERKHPQHDPFSLPAKPPKKSKDGEAKKE
jgi:hypothetical protein